MLGEVRKELVPIIIVLDLLMVWSFLIIMGRDIPSNVDTLVTAVVVFYFGSRTGAAAATRALNGYYTGSETNGNSSGTSTTGQTTTTVTRSSGE